MRPSDCLGSSRLGASIMTMFRAVEIGLGLDLADLRQILGHPAEQPLAQMRMDQFPTAEHDRELDLVSLLQEALDVTLLRLEVVVVDLGPQLDLFDADRRLPLARFLGLLLLLVPVLAVVHHLADRRVGHRGHLDQVEVQSVGVTRAPPARSRSPPARRPARSSRTASARIFSLMRTMSAMLPCTSPGCYRLVAIPNTQKKRCNHRSPNAAARHPAGPLTPMA